MSDQQLGIQNDLSISICLDPAEATDKGFVYERPEYLSARITKAVVVREGTESNRPTVDFIFQDEHGQKYVVMLTGRLLKLLAGVL